MKIRAVIFDIYKTLLDVAPPPADAAERWRKLFKTTLPGARLLSLEELDRRCRAAIESDHAAARARGIPFPEVYWPDIVQRAVPALARLGEIKREQFIFEHMRLLHTVTLAPGAADVLRQLRNARIPIGLVSNCQPYTLRELDEVLLEARFDMGLFNCLLSFLSYENGFSKPDPHVFRILTARLADYGITPAEALIVGDRLDNDIAPARAQDFQTWHLSAEGKGRNGGTWQQLGKRLRKFQ